MDSVRVLTGWTSIKSINLFNQINRARENNSLKQYTAWRVNYWLAVLRCHIFNESKQVSSVTATDRNITSSLASWFSFVSGKPSSLICLDITRAIVTKLKFLFAVRPSDQIYIKMVISENVGPVPSRLCLAFLL